MENGTFQKSFTNVILSFTLAAQTRMSMLPITLCYTVRYASQHLFHSRDVFSLIANLGRPMYYLLNVYFFTAMLSVMTLSVYQLPVMAREKCGLGTAVLFSVSVFMFSLTEKLPESSESVPIINIYLFFTMGLSAISLMFTIAVHAVFYMNKRQKDQGALISVPHWLVKFVAYYRRSVSFDHVNDINDFQNALKKKHFIIKKLRCYERAIDLAMDFSIENQMKKVGQGKKNHPRNEPETKQQQRLTKLVNMTNSAIERLVDSYELKVRNMEIAIEWHELARAFDHLLFRLFVTILIAFLTLIFGYAAFFSPTGIELIESKFQSNINQPPQ